MKKSPAEWQGANADDLFAIEKDQNERILLRSLTYYDVKEREMQEEDPLWIVYNWNVGARLQSGPSCGLVALRMAMETLNIGPALSSNDMLDAAIANKFSNKGEMFYAEQLASLGNQLFPTSTCTMLPLPDDGHVITSLLLEGKLILFPYDAAGNHTPGLFNGAKAHWALLKGVATTINKAHTSLETIKQTMYEENKWNVYFFEESERNDEMALFFPPKHDENTYFIGQQGKSKHQAVWSFAELKRSNQNLLKASNGNRDHSGLLLPPNLDGLRNKIVIISKKVMM